MKLIKTIKDIISPKKCYSCEKEWHFLCQECLQYTIKYKPYCYICKNQNNKFLIHKYCKKNIYFDKLIILTRYKNKVIKKLIKDFKFYNKKDIWEDFGKFLWKLLLKNEKIKNKEDYLLVPTPMFFYRKMIRWYNQSDILAKYIWKHTNIKIKDKLIKKIKNTRQQSLLSKKERILNLNNSFKINKKDRDILDKKNIILIDDIVSTWTTLNEIAKILKQNWVKKIIWLAIASD